jgi:hypothetical protein
MIGVRGLFYVDGNVTRLDINLRRFRNNNGTIVIKGERLAGSEGGRATARNMTCQIHGTVYLLNGDEIRPDFDKVGSGTAYLNGITGPFNEWYGYLIEPV